MGELIVIGRSPILMEGELVKEDIRLTWSNDREDEKILAEKTFKEYIIKGWLAIGEAFGEKKQIFTFDPYLEKIVLAPLMIGG